MESIDALKPIYLRQFKSNLKKSDIRFNYGGFALIEFLLSEYSKNPKKYSTALDIGSFEGYHTKLMRSFGIKVDQIDKYIKDAEINEDFNEYNFKSKYDVIYCSHVIEHQRNIGQFLDKIFDIMHDHYILIISGPKHPVERFVEGHINTCILPVFLQSLIYAGFDCKKGKMMQIGGIENSFIVKKDKNFCLSERKNAGYKWLKSHQIRSPVPLIAGSTVNHTGLHMYRCKAWEVITQNQENGELKKDEKGRNIIGLKIKFPRNYKLRNVELDINIWGNFFLFNEKSKMIGDKDTSFVQMTL